jgi:HPt (histidine-containing phosphotransfer) domain-containing protein
MTRREFHFALFAAAAALSVPSVGQEAERKAEDPASASVNAWLPAPMPPEQAQQVTETVKALQKTLQTLRAYPLPEGSELALTFHPLPPKRG